VFDIQQRDCLGYGQMSTQVNQHLVSSYNITKPTHLPYTLPITNITLIRVNRHKNTVIILWIDQCNWSTHTQQLHQNTQCPCVLQHDLISVVPRQRARTALARVFTAISATLYLGQIVHSTVTIVVREKKHQCHHGTSQNIRPNSIYRRQPIYTCCGIRHPEN